MEKASEIEAGGTTGVTEARWWPIPAGVTMGIA